jgi:surface protein
MAALTRAELDALIAEGADITNADVSEITDFSRLFYNMPDFNQDISGWNVSSAENMENMFYYAKAFNYSINSWNVSNVTNFNYMFKGCDSYNHDFTDWNTSSALTMNSMFMYCGDFNGDVTTWDVSKVTDIARMFWVCSEFNQDISGWDVSSVEAMHGTFYAAISFTQDVGDWDVSSVTNLNGTFEGASSFNQDLSRWNTSNVEMMGNTFDASYPDNSAFDQNLAYWDVRKVTAYADFFKYTPAGENPDNFPYFGQNLPPLPLPSVALTREELIAKLANGDDVTDADVSEITDFSGLFKAAGVQDTFNQNINDWNVNNATNFKDMFEDCKEFNQPLDKWNITNAINVTGMFEDCNKFNQDISNWVLGNSLTDLTNMFKRCSVLNQPFNSWDVSNITNFSNMFSGCLEFNQDLNSWNTSSAKYMQNLFASCFRFNGVIRDWDTSSVINLSFMFASARDFNQDISSWEVGENKNLQRTFADAKAFNQDLSNWNVSKVTSMNNTFYNAESFNIDIGMWDTSSVRDMTRTFSQAESFSQNLIYWDVRETTTYSNFAQGTPIENVPAFLPLFGQNVAPPPYPVGSNKLQIDGKDVVGVMLSDENGVLHMVQMNLGNVTVWGNVPSQTNWRYMLNGTSNAIYVPYREINEGGYVEFKVVIPDPSEVVYFVDSDIAGNDGRPYFFIWSSGDKLGNFGFNDETVTAYLDGLPIEQGVTPCPSDGLEHSLRLVVKANKSIRACTFGASFSTRENTTSATYSKMQVYDIDINGEAFYPINDGFSNNPNLEERDGGDSALAVDFVEGNWIELN